MQVQFKCTPASASVPALSVSAQAMPAAELPGGCGWYDSSHELRQGLQIREGGDEVVLALWFRATASAAVH